MTAAPLSISHAIDAVLNAKTDNFTELCAIAGLNPAIDFRGALVRGADFGDCDLGEFDFSGATLVRPNFSGATYGNALFNGTRFIDADLSQATDWDDRRKRAPITYLHWVRTSDDNVLDRHRQKVTGRIIAIEDDVAMIDVGGGFSRRINLKLLTDAPKQQLGDSIVIPQDLIESTPTLFLNSSNTGTTPLTWSEVKQAYQREKTVLGMIYRAVKGGFLVRLGSMTAFLPGGQVDEVWPPDVSDMLDDPQPFQILSVGTELDPNIIVSRLEALRKAERDQLRPVIAEMRLGDVVECTILRVIDQGLIVSTSGIIGLIHESMIPQDFFDEAHEPLASEKRIEAVVIGIDLANIRLRLSINSIRDNFWSKKYDELKVNDLVIVTIKNHIHYGIFVDLHGINALVHKQNIPERFVENLTDHYPIGAQFDAVIRSIDKVSGRIDLSFSDVEENPWPDFLEKNQIGDIIEGVIKNTSEHGLFINISGVAGLIPRNSFDNQLLHYDGKIGDNVIVKIANIREERSRVTLELMPPGTKTAISERLVHLSEAIFNEAKIGDVYDLNIFRVEVSKLEVRSGNMIAGYIPASRLIWPARKTWKINKKNLIGRSIRGSVVDKVEESRELVFSNLDMNISKFKQFCLFFEVNESISGKPTIDEHGILSIDLTHGIFAKIDQKNIRTLGGNLNKWCNFTITKIDRISEEIFLETI